MDLRGAMEIFGINEYHFPIVCGRWDNGGGYFLCMNSCIFARMYVGPIMAYISVNVCWCACMCVRTSGEKD